jgi:hypothetical protein
MSKEQDKIWQSIKGSEALYKTYGYYPTFHDAKIINFDVRFEPKEIILTIAHFDEVDNSAQADDLNDDDGCFKVVMSWRGVIKSNFCLDHNDIYAFEFRYAGKNIETTFTHSTGTENLILAESVHVISVSPSVDEELNTVNFTFAG